MKPAGLAISALILLLAATPSSAVQTEISSDKLERKGNIIVLEGSVVLKREDAVVRADRAVYNTGTDVVSAEGNVSYETGEALVEASRVEVNLKTEEGVLHDASVLIKKEGYRIRGAEIRKTGPNRYTVLRGTATTCEGLPPAWCFEGREVDVVLGERIKASHVVFRVKDVPVFYTPFLWAPILAERRTGLLAPTMGYRDSTGFYYRQPFFWAITENRDATLYLDYYSRRAFGQALEYRYVEGPGAAGRFEVYHLKDSIRGEDFLEWEARHRQDSRHVQGFLSLNLVNREDFFRLYEPYIEESSKRFLESSAEVAAPMGNSRIFALSRYFQDLKEGVDDKTVLQRLPEVGVFLAPYGKGPVLITATAAAARFDREEGERGQRLGAELEGTLSLGTGPTLTQTARAMHYYYRTEGAAPGAPEDRVTRRAYDYEATFLSVFERTYGSTVHSFEPSLSYRNLQLEGEDPPFFDSVESMSETSAAAFSLMNRLIGKKGEILTLQAIQSYDFLREDNPFLPLQVDMALRRPIALGLALAYSHEDERISTLSTRAAARFRKTLIKADYSYTYSTNVEVFGVEVTQGVTSALEVRAGARYDEAEEGGFEEVTSAVRYTSSCWGAEVSYVKKPEDYSVYLKLSLLGLGDFGVR